MSMSALNQLNSLNRRARIRKFIYGLKTPRRALVTIFGVLIFGCMLLPALFGFTNIPKPDPRKIRFYMPLAMLGLYLMSFLSGASAKALAFTLAEIDFLFPGPFSRRELLLYKLKKAAGNLVFLSLFLSIAFKPYIQSWISLFIGCYLAFCFMHLLSLLTFQIQQIIGEMAYSKLRKVVLAVIGITLFASIWNVMQQASEQGWVESFMALRGGKVGSVLFAPFDVFAQVVTADTLIPGLVTWAPIAAFLIAILVMLSLRLDADYLEAAAGASLKLHERIRQAGKGSMGVKAGKRTSRGWTLPLPPRMGGAGTVAWRQIIHATRSARGLLFFGVFFIFVSWPFFTSIGKNGSNFTGPAIGFLIYGTAFFAMNMPLGFRCEIDYMDGLKALPFRPMATSLGELLLPCGLLTIFHMIVLSLLAIFDPSGRAIVLATVPFIVPMNLLTISISNALFLLFPVRNMQSGTMDFGAMGKQMLVFFAEFIGVFLSCGLAGLAGGSIYWLSKSLWPIALAVAWLVLCAFSALSFFMVVWAFNRFDLSADMPD